MNRTADSGSSVVIAFVLLLMLFVAAITLWALIGVPAQLENAEENYLTEVEDSFIEYKLATDTLRVHDNVGGRLSMLLPGRSGFAGGYLQFAPDTGGTVTIITDGDDGNKTVFNISRLSGFMSRFSATTEIGYENGGVFRSDGSNATWLTQGLLEIYPWSERTPTESVTEIVHVNLTGQPEIGSNRYIPVTSVLLGREDIPLPWRENATITFTGTDSIQKYRWLSMFEETLIRWTGYNETLAQNSVTNEVTVSLLKDGGNDATLRLRSSNTSNVSVILLREAVYNVSITPEGVMPVPPTRPVTAMPTSVTPTPIPTGGGGEPFVDYMKWYISNYSETSVKPGHGVNVTFQYGTGMVNVSNVTQIGKVTLILTKPAGGLPVGHPIIFKDDASKNDYAGNGSSKLPAGRYYFYVPMTGTNILYNPDPLFGELTGNVTIYAKGTNVLNTSGSYVNGSNILVFEEANYTIPARSSVWDGSFLVDDLFLSATDASEIMLSLSKNATYNQIWSNITKIQAVIKWEDTVLSRSAEPGLGEYLTKKKVLSWSNLDLSTYNATDVLEICICEKVKDGGSDTYVWYRLGSRTVDKLMKDYTNVTDDSAMIANVTWWGVSNKSVLLQFNVTSSDVWNSTDAIQYVITNTTGGRVDSSSIYEQNRVETRQDITWSGKLNLSQYNETDWFAAHVRNVSTDGKISHYAWYNITGATIGKLWGDTKAIPPSTVELTALSEKQIKMTIHPFSNISWRNNAVGMQYSITDNSGTILGPYDYPNISLSPQYVGLSGNLNLTNYQDTDLFEVRAKNTWTSTYTLIGNKSIGDLKADYGG